MVDEAITSANQATARDLEALLAGLADAELELDLGEGWTVATALAHCAFWDRRAALVLERWQRDGTPYRDQDDDILNAALLEEWRALPVRTAAYMAIEAARAISARVAGLPEEISSRLKQDGNEFLMLRHTHWRDHIDQIKAALR